LLAGYEADLDLIRTLLAPGRVEAAAALASVPALVRGYGHVRLASMEKAAGERERLVQRLSATVEEPHLRAAE
jgi:indolepyruvate ferredoxin oxidoreductase